MASYRCKFCRISLPINTTPGGSKLKRRVSSRHAAEGHAYDGGQILLYHLGGVGKNSLKRILYVLIEYMTVVVFPVTSSRGPWTESARCGIALALYCRLHWFIYWRCVHSLHSKVYETDARPSVRLSVCPSVCRSIPSFARCVLLRRVCC